MYDYILNISRHRQQTKIGDFFKRKNQYLDEGHADRVEVLPLEQAPELPWERAPSAGEKRTAPVGCTPDEEQGRAARARRYETERVRAFVPSWKEGFSSELMKSENVMTSYNVLNLSPMLQGWNKLLMTRFIHSKLFSQLSHSFQFFFVMRVLGSYICSKLRLCTLDLKGPHFFKYSVTVLNLKETSRWFSDFCIETSINHKISHRSIIILGMEFQIL